MNQTWVFINLVTEDLRQVTDWLAVQKRQCSRKYLICRASNKTKLESIISERARSGSILLSLRLIDGPKLKLLYYDPTAVTGPLKLTLCPIHLQS